MNGLEQLRDIVGATAVPWLWWLRLAMKLLGLVALLFLIAGVIWYLYKRRRQEIIVSPYAAAQNIIALLQDMLARQDCGVRYYDLLDECVRDYTSRHFRFDIQDKTGAELSRLVLTTPPELVSHWQNLCQILAHGDGVRFGKGTASLNQAEQDLNWLKVFVGRAS